MPEEHIESFIWKGQTRYRCTGYWESGAKCEYDCASREQIIQHMRSPHLRAAPNTAPPVPAAAIPVADVADTESRAGEFAGSKFAAAENDD